MAADLIRRQPPEARRDAAKAVVDRSVVIDTSVLIAMRERTRHHSFRRLTYLAAYVRVRPAAVDVTVPILKQACRIIFDIHIPSTQMVRGWIDEAPG